MKLRRTRSIQRRLVTLFVLLALGTTAVFLLGMQRLLQGGWQAYAQPLVADYVDRFAARRDRVEGTLAAACKRLGVPWGDNLSLIHI